MLTKRCQNEEMWRLAGSLLREARKALHRSRKYPVDSSAYFDYRAEYIYEKGAAKRMLVYLREWRFRND